MSDAEINPEIGAMLRRARDWLVHEHSLFKTLDLKPVLIGKGRATFSLALPKEFCGADGNIHPSFLTIILDSICGLAVFTALESMKPIATINLRTDYLGDIGPGQRVACAATCVEIRDEIASMNADVTDEKDNRLIATGSGAFLVGARGRVKGSRL